MKKKSEVLFTRGEWRLACKAKKIFIGGGFTLIELLVATAIFGLVVVVIAAIFVSFSNAQRQATALQRAQEQGRYIMESMAKEIRMSAILSSNNFSPSGDSSINIRNANGDDITYAFSSGKLTRSGDANSGDLNAGNVNIAGKFFISQGTTLSGGKVTITMQILALSAKPSYQSEIDLQTTVAARGE